MQAEQFLDYLNQPARLLELPTEQLRELAVRYPYSANLRLLHLLKAELEHAPDAKLHLERAAAATFDRTYLHELLVRLQEQRQAATETATEQSPEAEVLELRELAELELLPLPESDAQEGPPLLAGSVRYEEDLPSRLNYDTEEKTTGEAEEQRPEATTLPPVAPSTPGEETTEVTAAVPSSVTPAALEVPEGATAKSDIVSNLSPPSPPIDLTAWSANASSFLAVLPNFPLPATTDTQPPAPVSATPRPEDPTRFLSPAMPNRADELQRRLAQLRARSLAAARTTDRTPTRPSFGPEPASETLAQVLVDQQQYPQAIRMYRRLMLSKPQKKAIFAALIDELKAKL